MEEELSEIIKKAKKEYASIDRVVCPALKNQEVYFNQRGFEHVIRKGRKFRTSKEIKRRLNLLPLAVKGISSEAQVYDYRETLIKNSVACFWALRFKHTRIILRKMNKGHIHFFSVFDEQ
jgi:hypothetical protein